MIYLLILLDIIIGNYSHYISYFFLVYLYNKKYKYYLLTGLILDIVIFKTGLLNTFILSIIYLLDLLFDDLNKHNFGVFVYINIFNYIMFISLSNVLLLNSVGKILFCIGSNLIINIMFYMLSYRVYIRNRCI